MNYKNLNDLHATKDDIIYLTNSQGETSDDIEVPEAPYEWYENIEVKSSTLLYLVKIKNQCGILAINEYDSVTVKDLFDGNYKAMREMIRRNAVLLCKDELVGEYMVFIGFKTGFCECDELGVFIPYETGYDVIENILKIVDETAYMDSTNKFDSGRYYNGFSCVSREDYGAGYIENITKPNGYVDEILIGIHDINGGCKSEAAVRWIMVDKKNLPQFEFFAVGTEIMYNLFRLTPFMEDFMKAKPDFTPDDLSWLLIKHGFVDLSDKKLPKE